MDTIILFHDYMGQRIDEKESDYAVYVGGETIIFKEKEFFVNGITYDEDQSIKYVRAYSRE
ncbi:hypothetical protein LCGC14_2028070 [marine sediment metagenome]|uniref:Uncharacterized protein n=1 Tax=marine sediment metagenome TaxID=412755 RepID=A0A0F9HSK1_9ZZZZ